MVKAIPHTTVLRQYIDSCDDSTISSLRKLLRAHFAVNSGKYAKKLHDKKPCSAALLPGDRLLIRNLNERGGLGKLLTY